VEHWLPVAGYEGFYEVSDLGRVRSLDRIVRGAPGHGVRLHRGRVLRQFHGQRRRRRDGIRPYLVVRLSRDGVKTLHKVHRLVGEAFLGPLPEGMETRHGPAGTLENGVVNLSFGTAAQNSADQDRDGVRSLGSGRPDAVLTDDIVRDCRTRCAAGETQQALAAEYGVSHQTMSKAIRGQTWQHV
jgi:hypothetical protein